MIYTMHKEALLACSLKSKGTPTLLGGQLPINVINNSQYISPLTAGDQVTEKYVADDLPSVDHAIHTALSDKNKTVLLVGPGGSGKTTALEKLVVDWAKGEHLQSFSYIFHFQFRELNSLDGMLSLETFMSHHHSHFSPESMCQVLQKPESLLFVFDELDQYKHSLDPSVHTLCSDPRQLASVSCLVASLLHGTLLTGAAFLVASRPTGCLQFLSGTGVDLLGFLKPQRKAFVNGFFTDPAIANRALMNMEETLGFYDFCTSPRFCWTVCSIYKSLMDADERLPETLTQVCVSIMVHLIQALSLNEARSRDLVSALGKMASHCFLDQRSGCTKEEIISFGFQQFLTSQSSADAFLRVDGDPESDGCVFSFHSQVMQEFLLAAAFFLDKSTSESVKEMLEKHEGHAKFLDVYLSGLSEPNQRRPLETLLGEFDSDRILDFKGWLKSSSQETLEGCYKEKHYRCFRRLHQSQNESLVKEIITPSARIGISYGDVGLQDCVALNYAFMCLGEMEQLNLYCTKDLTEEEAEMLAPAMALSQKIILSQSSLRPGSVPHLASALSKGRTKELDLSHSHLGDASFKILCTGLRDCKLLKLTLAVCRLTAACCGDLVSVLTSGTSQLCVLELMFNELGDRGLTQLCQALRSPHCKLQELQLQTCQLTAASMEVLSTALCSGQSELRKLTLTYNTIGDSGVDLLSRSLQHPLCKLQSLQLFDCQLTGACCASLAEALKSEHCCLLELDLSVNDLGQEGALLLCEALSRPGCPLEKLGLTRCELTHLVYKVLGSLLRSGTSRLKSLSVAISSVGDQGAKHLWDAVAHQSCLLEDLDVEMIQLTDACVGDLCAAVRASKTLRSLDLKNNLLTNASVPALVQLMQESHNMQELNLRYNDFCEEVFNMLDQCDKINY
uniref:NACHT, LRR and PYD domains-containing protein 3 isoform X1 n=2 Tax=Centroberyx gerrardi TaxID=166262 RepID=UPI003AB103A2